MEESLQVAGFMAFIGLICDFHGVPNINKSSDEFWVFITADMMAFFISKAVMIYRMSVGPKTWKKAEEFAKNALSVAIVLEVIAIRQVAIIVFDDIFWLRVFIEWLCNVFIGTTFVVIIVVAVKGGVSRDQVETATVNDQV